jgi:NTP pyrophosphatase (non-canonical NTP hydrolase)
MKRLVNLQSEIAKFAKDRDWDQFHSPKNLAMALAVEAAEVMELFQWLTEDQSKNLSPKKKSDLADELADTYIYLLKIAAHYNIDLIDAAKEKIRKTDIKYPVHKARGSAKKYTEL